MKGKKSDPGRSENLLSVPEESPDPFFHLTPAQHNLMAAAAALQTAVCTGTDYFPFKAAARMLFLHMYDITLQDFHNDRSFLLPRGSES